MKKIAIITPCILPVPALMGGAVEELITRILDDNEKSGYMIIDLYTIGCKGLDKYSYRYTNLICIDVPATVTVLDSIGDKILRRIKGSNSRRILDKLIIQRLIENIEQSEMLYDAVIVENMASTAIKVVDVCKEKYDFPIYFHMHNDVDIYRSNDDIDKLKRSGVQIIAVSNYLKNRVLHNLNEGRVSVLYNGTAIDPLKTVERRDGQTIRFLYAGRIIREKGVLELIEAFERLDDSGKYTLEIYGGSDEPTRFEKQIIKLAGENTSIHCHKRISHEEIQKLYSHADVVVIPTIQVEAFGLVALEAMANGVALITTNSGGLPEVVGNGALVVEKDGDFVTALSKAMKELAYSEQYRRELAERALAHVKSIADYNIENYFHNLKKIISEEEITSEDMISVIVPVYNVEQYLSRCLKSILTQTYRNIELLIIDDGSTDTSGNICDIFAEEDNRVKVIHQENMGLSGARNTGLDNAAGRYVFFCDSDDYLQSNALEIMLCRLKKDHSDIVACGIAKVYEPGKDVNEKTEIFTSAVFGRWSGYEGIIQMLHNNNICTVVWNKLYKRELFEELRFPLGVKNEDEAILYRLLYRSAMISYIPDILYNYSQRQSSIMHEMLEDRYRFNIDASIDRINFFKNRGEDELKQHSMITFLEWIKYAYRNIENKKVKRNLINIYKDNINVGSAPSVMGIKKKLALLIWKYYRY